MTITSEDIRNIQARLAPILGKKAWQVSLGIGSFVTMEFGAPLPPRGDGEQIRGEWHLWIMYCAWRLDNPHRVLAACEDSREHLTTAVQALEGR